MGTTGGALVYLNWATEGGFWLHVVTANLNRYEVSVAVEWFLFVVFWAPL